MRKVHVFAGIAIMMATAGGCRMCDWLWRGSSVSAPATVVAPMAQPMCYPDACVDPCATTVAPCAPAASVLGPGPG